MNFSKNGCTQPKAEAAWSKIMKKIFILVSFLVFAAILLTACTGSSGAGSLTTWPKATKTSAVGEPIQPISPTPTAPEPIFYPPLSSTSTPAELLQPTPTSPPAPEATLPPPPPQPIRFAVIGDFGSGNRNEGDVAALVKSWNPDFIVTVGDNNYPDGAADTIDENIGQFFHEYIAPYQGQYGAGGDKLRFFPVLGNHDWNTDHGQPYLDYFALPGNERYYDFTWGPVQFFMISSDSREPDGVSRKSIQAQWLEQGLAASQSPWKLVVMHHPAYSSGTHGSVDWMRWPFQSWGADAALAGHDHLYERLIVDGLPYFTNGLGGGAIYSFLDNLEGSQVRYNDDYGAMLVTATPQNLVFEFYNRQNELIDRFELNR